MHTKFKCNILYHSIFFCSRITEAYKLSHSILMSLKGTLESLGLSTCPSSGILHNQRRISLGNWTFPFSGEGRVRPTLLNHLEGANFSH
jgi:hypothetical protein